MCYYIEKKQLNFALKLGFKRKYKELKTNLVIVSLIDIKTKEIATKLATDFDLYFADVNDILDYNLFNAGEIEKNCGVDYLNKLKRKTIKEIGSYENTLISISNNLFVADNNAKNLNKYGTVVFLNYSKPAIEKYIKSLSKQEEKNQFNVMMLAYNEIMAICLENCDMEIPISKLDFDSNYKKVKKVIDKYYL